MIHNCEFLIDDLKEQVKKLKLDKSSEINGIHPYELILCAGKKKERYTKYKQIKDQGPIS